MLSQLLLSFKNKDKLLKVESFSFFLIFMRLI